MVQMAQLQLEIDSYNGKAYGIYMLTFENDPASAKTTQRHC